MKLKFGLNDSYMGFTDHNRQKDNMFTTWYLQLGSARSQFLSAVFTEG